MGSLVPESPVQDGVVQLLLLPIGGNRAIKRKSEAALMPDIPDSETK